MAEHKEPTQIEKNIGKLQRLLADLFQFESSDLDFGIYRIINQKQAVIRKFVDKELVESIGRQCSDIHATPEETAEIFDHIYQFFSRYYDKGDYMPLHRHSLRDKKYAVPWNGEEVVLHWANKDQYYIKTGRNFKNYVFHDEEKKFRFHFTIIESQESANNVKQEDHYFILSDGDDAVEYNDATKNITFKFTYEPLNKDEAKRRSGAPASDYQKAFRISAEKRIIELLEITAKEEKSTARKNNILTLLGILNKKERGKTTTSVATSNPTFLEKKLNRYVQENKSDYFIHKDLGGFLRQELDTYIKREMWDLDDLIGTAKEVPGPDQLKRYTDRIRIMRNISLEIITFLAQIEDFQKRLFEKKKFVLSADYCITLDHISKKFYPAILDNKGQIAEWKKLFGIGDPRGQSTLHGDKINEQFLEEHPHLIIDTQFFSEIKEDLIDSIQDLEGKPLDDLDEATIGLLIKSENLQALNLLHDRYQEQVKCIYIDPPYNTGNDEFLYKDRYQYSSWQTMMADRIQKSFFLLEDTGSSFCSIGEDEQYQLKSLYTEIFGLENQIASVIWQKSKRGDAKLIAQIHEYLLSFGKNKQKIISEGRWRLHKEGVDEVLSYYNDLRTKYPNNHDAINEEMRKWYSNLPANDPRKAHQHYRYSDGRGLYFADNFHGPDDGRTNRPRYDIIHPKTGKSCKKPSTGWRWEEARTIKALAVNPPLIHFGPDETTIPCRKTYLKDVTGEPFLSVFYKDGRAGTIELEQLMGYHAMDYPKNTDVIERIIQVSTEDQDTILDYFAGSGTTGHAVMNLNKEESGNRKYILIEMAGYFDTVMKPRIEKVIYSADWKEGKPIAGSEGQSHIFKYMALEQYEDTLNNIAFTQMTLDVSAYDDYLIKYMLDFETRESPCLFGITSITDPWAYQLKFYDENVPKMETVDLIETFNYLLGIHIKGYRTYIDGETRYRVVIGSKNDVVIVIIWRKTKYLDLTADKEFIENEILPRIRTTCKRSPEKIYINADFHVKDALPIEPEFFGIMGG